MPATSPEEHLEQGHPDRHPVARLAEVRGPRVGVDLGVDLVDTGQRVHDDRPLRQPLHQPGIDAGVAASASELTGVGEALLLDAGLVDDVAVGHRPAEVVGHRVGDPSGLEQGEDVRLHLHHRGGHEGHPHPLVAGEEQCQRARRAPVAEVAAEHHVEAVDPAQLAVDGEQVEEGLGRVLARPVPGVDDRDPGHHGGAARRPRLIVAEDDHVGVGLDHPDRVLEGLALDRAGELARRLGADHRAAQPHHRGFEGEPGPGAGLVEEGGHDPAVEAPVPHPVEGGGPGDHVLEQVAVELVSADDVVEEPGLRRCHHHRGLRRPAVRHGVEARGAGERHDPLADLSGPA